MPTLAPTLAGRIADTVLYAALAAVAAWWALLHILFMTKTAATMFALFIAVAVAARIWLYGPPAWWLRVASPDYWRLVRRSGRP